MKYPTLPYDYETALEVGLIVCRRFHHLVAACRVNPDEMAHDLASGNLFRNHARYDGRTKYCTWATMVALNELRDRASSANRHAGLVPLDGHDQAAETSKIEVHIVQETGMLRRRRGRPRYPLSAIANLLQYKANEGIGLRKLTRKLGHDRALAAEMGFGLPPHKSSINRALKRFKRELRRSGAQAR